jgi:hypothetical protein
VEEIVKRDGYADIQGNISEESLEYGQAINGGVLHANGYTDWHAGSFESGYQASLENETEEDFEEHQRSSEGGHEELTEGASDQRIHECILCNAYP